MFCKKCGKKVSEGEKYCSSCGTSVSDSNQDEHNHKNSHGCCITIITILLAIATAAGSYFRVTTLQCKKTCHDDYGCLNQCKNEKFYKYLKFENHLNFIQNMFSSSNTSEELSPSARDVIDTTLNRSRTTEDISACNSQLVADTLAEIVSGVEELPDNVKASTIMTVQQKSNGSLKECETTLLVSYPKSYYNFFDKKCLESISDYLEIDKDFGVDMLKSGFSRLFVDTGISYQFTMQKLKYTTESIIDKDGDDSVYVTILDTDEQSLTIGKLRTAIGSTLRIKECSK